MLGAKGAWREKPSLIRQPMLCPFMHFPLSAQTAPCAIAKRQLKEKQTSEKF